MQIKVGEVISASVDEEMTLLETGGGFEKSFVFFVDFFCDSGTRTY